MPETIPEADLLGWLARYDYERGSYASARHAYERELEFRRRVQGPEHPQTLASMNNLAMTLARSGRFDGGAQAARRRTLPSAAGCWGRSTRIRLPSMNNLSLTMLAQGDLAEARQAAGRGAGHFAPGAGAGAPRYTHLDEQPGRDLAGQGDLAEARKLQEKVLAIRSWQRVGLDHPDTLQSMNNLALTIQRAGRLGGARNLHEEALDIVRRLLGPEHPYTLTSMNNLSNTLHAQNDLAGARKLQQEVLEIQRRVLGSEHPATLMSMYNLARTLTDQRDLAGARQAASSDTRNPASCAGVRTPGHVYVRLEPVGDASTTWVTARERGLYLEQDLVWMLARDPATLSANQRQIREMGGRGCERKWIVIRG